MPRALRFCTIAFAGIVVLVIAFAVYTHRLIGGSIFELGCVSERGGVLANLFMTGRADDHQWWYGIGFTFWILVRFPLAVFCLIAGVLRLVRVRRDRIA